MTDTTVCSRIPTQLHAALEAASESDGEVRSELIRRALRYYIEQNPDGIAVLEQDQAGDHERQGPDAAPSPTRLGRIYDPSREPL